MKIVVFGASGKTGLHVVEQALEAGHQVVAYVRNAASVKQKHERLEVVVGNLDNLEQIRKALQGAQICISTLGGASLTKHGLLIREGIKNIVQLVKELNVGRLIYMSSIGAGESRAYMPQPLRFLVLDLFLRIPIADHTINEQTIMQSGIHYTLVRPGGLTDGAKTGKLSHGSEKVVLKGNASISRANVAHFMIQEITQAAYVDKAVWLKEGSE